MNDCPCCGAPLYLVDDGACQECGYNETADGLYDCVDCELSRLQSGPAEWHARTHAHNVRGLEVDGHARRA